MVTESEVVADLLECGLDDWVALHDVVWYGTQGEVNPQSKVIVVEVLRCLFAERLMVPGDLLEEGFVDWPEHVDWLGRAESELERFGWAPMGDGFWLRLTDRGRSQAEGLS
ncbi:hypothetical protein [Austwickia sp. TVS 96-490-7B]|uniref:hypothetical protein n=1 Tax=Austwickia sp. TVS 96-490-7B TaxID=2830843 RepID=UPI001C593933|nr:hypothetical protein [Austwickia sp. TVS 96-490-7B]